jgi:hypothetical protein
MMGLLPFGSIPSGGSESKEGWAAHATLLDVGMAPIPPQSLWRKGGNILANRGGVCYTSFPCQILPPTKTISYTAKNSFMDS